ncbi:MAG: hypothetical protein K2P59_11000 [Acetatifactor sp.]|nr:hypothetical protein [Acetatifactor sp.]
MKSDIIQKAEHLYNTGNVNEALQYYAVSLWRGEEDSPELLFPWLGDRDLVAKAGEQAVCGFIAGILLSIDRYEESLREQLWALCQNTLDSISVCEDRQDTTDRYVVECNLYRHKKEPEKALEIITKGLERGGTASRYTFAGLTYLDLEKEEEAEKYLALGYESDPSNAALYNDLGDYYFRKRRWRKAGECYYKVLEAGNYNDCSWAEPSWIFCCFMEDASPYEKERLVLCAAADLNNERAQELCRMAVFESMTPNVDYLNTGSESIINALRSMREKGISSGVVRCATTCQESASSINAVRLGIEQICGEPSAFELTSGKAQDPPLDETLDEEGILLWNYPDINTPVAAVERPCDHVSSLVEALASMDFYLPAWYEAAKEYADKLSKTEMDDLYGVMVFPPKQKDNQLPAEEWLLRVQIAAVCILAHLSLHELDRICKGQLDWPVIPAFTLAAWLSSQDTAYAQWAENILNIVESRISKKNYCFFEYAYVCAAYLLPGKEESYYTGLWQRRQEWLGE